MTNLVTEAPATDTSVATTARKLSDIQMGFVRVRAAEIGNMLLSKQIRYIVDLDAAIKDKASELLVAEHYVETALKERVKGFSVTARLGVPKPIRKRLGIIIPPDATNKKKSRRSGA